MWRVSVQYIRTSSHVKRCCSINSLVQNVLRTKLGYQPLHQIIEYIYIYIYIYISKNMYNRTEYKMKARYTYVCNACHCRRYIVTSMTIDAFIFLILQRLNKLTFTALYWPACTAACTVLTPDFSLPTGSTPSSLTR